MCWRISVIQRVNWFVIVAMFDSIVAIQSEVPPVLGPDVLVTIDGV
jgi:hypothetical protein